ncbi:MAG: hypothetical protein ABI968_07655 [Acidobacteriota bacterium]
MMDISTNRPGDGRGEAKPGKPSAGLRPESATSEPGFAKKEDGEPIAANLLGADGERIPISGGFAETVADKGRSLGRSAGKSWKRLSESAGDMAQRNPTRTALTALGVGIVAGAIFGMLLSRD